MKIASIDVYPITVGDGSPWTEEGSYLFAKVTTDDGLYGMGEAQVLALGHSVAEAIRHVGKLLVGADPFSTEALWQKTSRNFFYPADTVLASAISAIDMALWDIKGKALGLPVYKLLGGPTRQRLTYYHNMAREDTGDLDAVVRAAVQATQAGWRHLRLWLCDTEPGVLEPEEAVPSMLEKFRLVREAVGDSVELIVDFHTRLDTRLAIFLCNSLEPYRPAFIEDPIRSENPASYRTLARHVRVPFAAGEQWPSRFRFRELIEEELVAVVRPDVSMVGGITETMKLAHWCETHFIDVIPHGPQGPVSTAACNHVSFAATNVPLGDESPGLGTLLTDVFPVQPRFEHIGYVRPPELPGLGVEFNEEAAGEYDFTPYHLTPLTRRDGSVNNW